MNQNNIDRRYAVVFRKFTKRSGMSSIKIYEIQRYVFIITIIIICHELGLYRPVSSSPISLFKGFSSRLFQFGL